jgi:MFS family permease
MTSSTLMLAQAAETSPEMADTPLPVISHLLTQLDILHHPSELLSTLSSMHIVWASVLVVVGALCILNGYRWHKYVIVICAFLGGLGLGHLLSQQMGQSKIVMAAIGLLCAVIATPMLRIAVAVFGGLTGAFIGANAWTAFSTSDDAHLAGAAMGFIAVGMLAFIMYRLVIVLFTAIGGAAMVVLGGVTLMLHVPGWESAIRNSLSTHPLLLSLLVAVAAVTGFVLQHSEMQGRGKEEQAERG